MGGPPTVTWCCSTRPKSAPDATTTGEHASQHHGRLVRKARRHPYRGLWRARCSVMGTPSSGGGPGKPTGGNTSRAPRSDLTDTSKFVDWRFGVTPRT
jgi:hypothetical protein